MSTPELNAQSSSSENSHALPQPQSPATEAEQPPLPLRIYTRPQILRFHSSSLVSLPQGMPELKDWFGLENEQNMSKRDNEPPTPNSARERRFRRDAEDPDASSRSTYRNQNSQMGSFKHQSARNDRDDKDGPERLRNLSEKYDRDRLNLPSGRNKDKESAPHLSAGSSRLSGPQLSTVASRRAETRDAAKRKNGEGDDWRKGGENRRTDRARSRSRLREDSRKEEKETDDIEDPRRWRDDGKRDERIATRRERERREKENGRDGSDRWTVVDDSRSKRTTARDRKSGSEETRDRDKDKEPAWMDTYIPPPSTAGILGGQGADGELDGIQVWKKGLKEKEQQEKESAKDDNTASDAIAQPLDEIQQFKLMMKKEQERMQGASNLDNPSMPSQVGATASLESTKPPVNPTQSLLSILTSGEAPSNANKNVAPSADSGITVASRLFPNSLPPVEQMPADNPHPPPAQFSPPQQSRLLALGSRPPVKPANSFSQQTNGISGVYNQPPTSNAVNATISKTDALQIGQDTVRPPSGFSPFEEAARASYGVEDNASMRQLESAGRSDVIPADPGGYTQGRGSRFAKFFDGKAKEVSSKPQTPMGMQSVGQKQDVGLGEQRTMDDLFAMLNSSAQVQRSNMPPSFNQHPQASLQLLQQVQQQSATHRMEPLYESRMDNRNFVPDGMVPGLRPSLAPRGRDGVVYSDGLDDSPLYNGQRVGPLSQRGLDPSYPGLTGNVYNSQSRNAMLQPHYRGTPTGMPSSQPSHLQRLPPGLANLGGRPPHEPSQFSSMQYLQQQQQQFNNFGAQSHMRLPPAQMQNSGIPMGGISHSNNIDLRSASQAQLLGLGGNRGGFTQGPNLNTMQNPLMGMRPQQQHVNLPHILPPQLAQNHQTTSTNSNAHDLMALLMGGPRE